MRMLARIKLPVQALRHDRRAVAAAEFALIVPVLVTLLLGVFEIGNAVHQQLVLQQALRAGGLYALSFPTQTGEISPANNGILLAIQAALPPSWTMNVAAAPLGTTNATVTATLSGGPPYFVKLTASVPYVPVSALLPIFPSTYTENKASYEIRVQ
jgi:Flp pilus assembly protein TadG